MKVFIVFAHPERRSLNGALLTTTVEELEAQGHEVQVSDLYAMQWKSQVDRADFPHLSPEARLKVAHASAEATASNTLTDDVKREQEKLLWADTVIFQYPMWWMGMPAILKGWFERVVLMTLVSCSHLLQSLRPCGLGAPRPLLPLTSHTCTSCPVTS